MSQKSLKGHSTTNRFCGHVRGSLGRIAKRRYTRDLFDDIIESAESHSENTVSDEEKLLTLFRCFNNFFNKKFDSERLFKAYSYAMSKERSKIITSWLRQKKADNIYVIGRFILHISSFLEDQSALQPNRIRECGNFLNLIFCETTDVLDENFILIFSFLSRKGYFRSISGFILKNFKINLTNVKNCKIQEKATVNDINLLDTWIVFLVFPLIFAVKWRIKVEEWLKAESERSELYGSNNSIDDDYANTSIMNMSLMSVSSEYSSEDPHSRQTRLFLKRLLSSWCNSVYFDDVFYQYFVSHVSINLSNSVLINAVPVYLIILALVEPTRQKRKYSIDSILSYNKTLQVLYKLNANPSLGLLNLLVSGICGFEQAQGWKNIGQEEAYGIVVCIHLTTVALFKHFCNKDGTEENNFPRSLNYKMEDVNNLNDNLKVVLAEIGETLSQTISQVFRIALSGLLDPNVVLPLAYFYQNLKEDLKISQQSIFGCRMILSKNMPFLRFIWSLSQQAVSSRSPSFKTSTSERHFSDSNERLPIFKIVSEGKFVPSDDMERFLSILSTMLECVTFHLNTLYQAETRRKTISSYGTSPAAVCSNFLLWPELWNMTSELAFLSIGLIRIVISCVNLNENDISLNQCQCKTNLTSVSHPEIIMEAIQNLLYLMRIFYIHVDKLNSDNTSIDEKIADIDSRILRIAFTKQQIQSIFDNTNFVFNLKDSLKKDNSNRDGLIKLFILKCLPPFCYKEIKLAMIQNFLKQFKSDYYSNNLKTLKQNEVISINYENQSFFKDVLQQILNNSKISIFNAKTVILNEEKISMEEFLYRTLHEGLDPVNHLFSCDGNQLLYPNPYVESFIKDYKSYYELLGKIFAMNILNGKGLQRRFSSFFLEKLLFVNERIYNINDLNVVDMEVAKNLLLLSKTDDELDCFNFKFVLTQNTFGKLHTYQIVNDGANIPVTNENKNEYIHRVVEFLLDKQIKTQCESFRKGIDSIFPMEIFTLLSIKDLQRFLSDH